jgi:hypothetical protein
MSEVRKVTWKCRDGRILPVAEMTDEHLVNAMCLLRRAAKYKAKLAEQKESVFEEVPFDYSEDQFLPPQYQVMVDVAKARGLLL